MGMEYGDTFIVYVSVPYIEDEGARKDIAKSSCTLFNSGQTSNTATGRKDRAEPAPAEVVK
jgi:hypothetical protein